MYSFTLLVGGFSFSSLVISSVILRRETVEEICEKRVRICSCFRSVSIIMSFSRDTALWVFVCRKFFCGVR